MNSFSRRILRIVFRGEVASRCSFWRRRSLHGRGSSSLLTKKRLGGGAVFHGEEAARVIFSRRRKLLDVVFHGEEVSEKKS